MPFLSCAQLLVLGLSDEPRTFEVSVVERNDASGSEHEGPGEPRSPDRCPRFEGTENVDSLYYAGIQRAQDDYYKAVAEQLRFVETCRIDSARSARNSNSTLAMECGLGELEWLAPCILPVGNRVFPEMGARSVNVSRLVEAWSVISRLV
jgi:hypothetical protein